MEYLVLIIIFIIVAGVLSKKTFYWETIIKYLWKQIYGIANIMAAEIDAGQNETLYKDRYKKLLDLRGNLINSILDYVNDLEEKDEDEDREENTFGYGRYNFETILMLARSKPNAFKKLK